tara:strand:+ start:570 stop:1214 length:645 start_codon:yes stop_codon:yes gene_type:complete
MNKKAATTFQIILVILAVLFLVIMAQIVWEQIKAANESGYDPLLAQAVKDKCGIRGTRFANTIDDGDGYPDTQRKCDKCVGFGEECSDNLASCNDSPDNDLDTDGIPNGCDLLPNNKLLGVNQVLCGIVDSSNSNNIVRKWGYELYFEKDFTQQCCTEELFKKLEATKNTPTQSPWPIGFSCKKIDAARKTELLKFIKDDKLNEKAKETIDILT